MPRALRVFTETPTMNDRYGKPMNEAWSPYGYVVTRALDPLSTQTPHCSKRGCDEVAVLEIDGPGRRRWFCTEHAWHHPSAAASVLSWR